MTDKEPRSLAAILQDAVDHGKVDPTHGTNCIHMDWLLREMRAQIQGVLPDSTVEPEWERRIDAQLRVSYLMRAAARHI